MPQRTQRKGHRATRPLPHLGARQQATRCPLLYGLYGKFLARSPMGNYKPLTLRVATLHRVLATGYKIATCHHFLYGSQARVKRSRSPSACLGWMINVASLGSPIRAKLDFSSYAFIQKTPFCIIATRVVCRPALYRGLFYAHCATYSKPSRRSRVNARFALLTAASDLAVLWLTSGG